jgi:hypothetical protein
MPAEILLPTRTGALTPHRPGRASPYPLRSTAAFPRIVYAAAHVVADPIAMQTPWDAVAIDWESTLAFRHHLWNLGFRIAEAMDTSQRGMGFDWASAQELIRRSIAEAKARPGADLASGAGTDQLAPDAAKSIADVIVAYEEQIGFIEGLGGWVILMASRALAALARSADDYVAVYDRLLAQVAQPVILHWLGDMFDPALAGYWGERDFAKALDVVVDLIRRHAAKVDGIKMSLLDAQKEVLLRSRLPEGVRTYTGDDFNYPDLLAGDGSRHSHGLLGIFDPIAPAAAAALEKLGASDRAGFDAIMAPTVPLSRAIFEAPTRYYKAGIVFLAWLNGHQDHFVMVGGMQSARSIAHYADVYRLADAAGLIADPDRAMDRMRSWLIVHGIG